MAQLTAALHRMIEFGYSTRKAAAHVNAQAANAKKHRVTVPTLGRLHKSLPDSLRTPRTSSEVLLLDYLQQQHSSQRQHLSSSLSLLTPLEDDLLAQWVQERCNMNQSPEKDEIIDHARMIMKKERNVEHSGQSLPPSHTVLPPHPFAISQYVLYSLVHAYVTCVAGMRTSLNAIASWATASPLLSRR